ncbi:MAG: BatA domain-containing protein [Planctomycetes bacterium]|nr:BatA domain-containing protein [Planctomycetota bacterium]
MTDWFSNPAGFWALTLLAPLLLLYMLRHRPVRRRVPSVLLWAGVAEAQVSTSPFQRLRKSLSLFLMLAALLAMLLALSGFRIPRGSPQGLPITIVIDATAGMGAREGDRTRLDLARELAREVIEAAGSTRVSALSWDGSLRPLAPADSSAAAASSALDALQVSPRGADSAGLSRALKQLAGDSGRHVVIIGDRDPGTEGNVRFLPVGSNRPNAAIVTASVNEPAPGRLEITFGIELFGADQPQRVTVALQRSVGDGTELVDARDETLEPGRRIASTFTVREAGLYRGVLRINDALGTDDSAWLRATLLPVLPVYVSAEAPEPVRRALSAIEQGMGTIRMVASADGTATVLTGREGAGAQPRLPAAFLGPIAAPPGVTYGAEADASATAARPLPAFLWRGAGTPGVIARQVWPVSFEGLMRPVLEVDGGPAVALCERDNGLRDLVVGMSLTPDGGTFQDQPAFVIFWANWFDYVRGLLDPLPRGALTTRDSLRVPALDGRERYSLTGPASEGEVELAPGAGHSLHAPGIYRTRGLETSVADFGVSLLDATESDLAVTQNIDNAAVMEWIGQGAESGERGALDLGPWLALIAAALLVIEWLLFRRRFPRRPVDAGQPSTNPHTRAMRA